MTADNGPSFRRTSPTGGFVEADGLEWYRIDDYDHLDPFLVNVVTPTDQWMYVSSSGALTAGRRSDEGSLFPYETDDRLHRAGGRVGPVTIIRIGDEVWRPFAADVPFGRVTRSILKTTAGDRLRFEERHPGLGLTFRYTWATADRFGFVRSCELLRHDGLEPVDLVVLDGLADVLPSGIEPAAQASRSTLVDAYRRSELDVPSGMALFTLEALISDRPEPAESLRAATIWSSGLPDPVIALSDRQVRAFLSGEPFEPEHLVTGRKGGFLASASATAAADAPISWMMAADVELDHRGVAGLREWLLSDAAHRSEVDEALAASHRTLIDVVADADALQETEDRSATAHHFANVLFNVMRGGVFLNDHRITLADAARFVSGRNRPAAGRFEGAVAGLGDVAELSDVGTAVAGDPDLERLVAEYLPLGFSRRHGDPSRPWNRFEISPPEADGSPATGYEGNWRDIFQNWDALLHSFPGFAASVVAKFLNASTVDGFNPYRITDDGIDWEVPEEGSWGNLGYWGDHQIAYLHRLLDVADRFEPGVLEADLGRTAFSYGDVPYRLVPYAELVRDPKNTIVFDWDRQAEVERRVAEIGADGRLVPAADGDGVHHASLAEKLLVPALSKLSNLVMGGGIWMNTQRPEWNDANNALVGNGVSMVTLFYLRDYLRLVDGLLARSPSATVPVGDTVAAWITGLDDAFAAHAPLLDAAEVSPEDRRSLLDALGEAFSEYRAVAYASGPGAPVDLPVERLQSFLSRAGEFLDHSAASARRGDGLVESYALLRLGPGTARVEPLYEMLEGQVAILTTEQPAPAEVVEMIDALFESGLYRPDQHSFLLYPNRRLPSFGDKNAVPEAELGPAARGLLEAGSEILYRDAGGVVRFGPFPSARELGDALDDLPDLDPDRRQEILALYETVFHHAAFTGRSGTMYRYEGLGSIYWHMVSKLLLAIQERTLAAVDAGDGGARDLADRYRRVRSGLGFAKSVAEQGSFPTDPHSHTPAHTGAQQPGMTGQVKEGVLLRWGELGVRIEGGRVRFRPVLLDPAEFLTEPREWAPFGERIGLEPGTLGFAFCGVPVVYHLEDGQSWAEVRRSDGSTTRSDDRLSAAESSALFSRGGAVARIDVGVSRGALLF